MLPRPGAVPILSGERADLEAEHSVRILIVEDERKVASALREGLEPEHHEVSVAAYLSEWFGSTGQEKAKK